LLVDFGQSGLDIVIPLIEGLDFIGVEHVDALVDLWEEDIGAFER
jgi:hypothetical protein